MAARALSSEGDARAATYDLTRAPALPNGAATLLSRGSARRPAHKVRSVAKPDLGGKRQCLNCGTKFFDLNKDPITCPKCGTIFQVAAAAAPVRASRATRNTDDDETETEDNAETVPLEDADADANEDGKVTAATPEDDDGDSDDDSSSDDDDTFLEEDEEEDGDVSNLIDGEIENDEER